MSQYFTNIKSLADLKSQYRALAMANHPDKGGNTTVMQAINAEYDKLYVIWVRREPIEVRPTDTAEQSRRFYTPYGWAGSNYDRSLSTKEIAALVREYAKTHWNQWKFSVRCHFASMCSEIRIELKGGPIENGITKTDECSMKYGIQTNYRYHDHCNGVDPMAEVVMKDVVEYCQSFNYDDSDAMIDYFDTNFYLSENVAGRDEWKVTTKKARITAPTSEVSTTSAQLPEGIRIMPYTDRSLVVVGNTKPIKDKLKELGGRFNPALTIDDSKVAGWVFSSNRYTVESLSKELGV